MLESAAAAVLVALGAVPTVLVAAGERARWAAIHLAVIAVGTQHDLLAATHAQEQAGGAIHSRPRADSQRCWTGSPQRCNTAAAPPSSARCRVWRGRRCNAIETVAVPVYFGIAAVVQRISPSASRSVRPQPIPSHCAPGTTARSNAPPPAWPPSGGQAGEPHPSSSAIDCAANKHVKPRNQHYRHLNAGPRQRSQPARRVRAPAGSHCHAERRSDLERERVLCAAVARHGHVRRGTPCGQRSGAVGRLLDRRSLT